MAAIVLVAGAWHGGWCWSRVTPLLRRAGHEVFTPTLTGLGERSHLASREITFETHVKDVVNVLEYENLSDVILLGHSYGGAVVGAVAHQIPERVERLLFLDALLPKDGKSLLDVYLDHGLSEQIERWQLAVDQHGDGWMLPAPPADSLNLRITSQSDIEWVGKRLGPQPFRTLSTPAVLGNPQAESIPRTYISCLPHPPGGLIPVFTRQVQEDPTWDYREMSASHDPMITDPQSFVDLLLEIIAPHRR